MGQASREYSGAALVALCLAALSVTAVVPRAEAQANPDQPNVEFEQRDSVARQHFQWGGAAYGRGDFEEAIREFREAHRLSGRPVLLFNLYLAYRDARRDVLARDTLREYLSLVPEAPNRPQLEARLRALETALASDAAVSEPDAATPDATTAADPAGDDATDGQSSDADAAASAGPPPREPDADASGGALVTLGWIGVGVGGAALVGALVTGILAQGAASDLEAGCGPMKLCPAALRGTYDDASTFGTITDVLWIGGGTLALAGVTLLLVKLLSSDDESEPPAVSPAAACSSVGCSAHLRMAF